MTRNTYQVLGDGNSLRDTSALILLPVCVDAVLTPSVATSLMTPDGVSVLRDILLVKFAVISCVMYLWPTTSASISTPKHVNGAGNAVCEELNPDEMTVEVDDMTVEVDDKTRYNDRSESRTSKQDVRTIATMLRETIETFSSVLNVSDYTCNTHNETIVLLMPSMNQLNCTDITETSQANHVCASQTVSCHTKDH
jgi:hypothetical protein